MGSSTTRSVDKKALGSWATHDSDGGRLAAVLLELSEAEKQLTAFVEPLSELSVPEDGYKVVRQALTLCTRQWKNFSVVPGLTCNRLLHLLHQGRMSDIEFPSS